jgi:UDPglucose 6-dehydrogenase
MKISIIGTGYVGLVTGACLAELGNQVTCMDKSKNKVRDLDNGSIPFYEPELENLVKKNIPLKNLSFTDSYKDACKNQIIFVCVDTPDNEGKPNLKNFNSCITSILKHGKSNTLIVTKSTIPLGTNTKIELKLRKYNQKNSTNFKLASNPEFLKEGSAVQDFFKPDRIIIGTNDFNSKNILQKIYAPLSRNKNKIISMSPSSAELTKYAANAFLATKISFINEISQISEKTNANIHDIRKGLGSDPRIGSDFIYAGIGYGGSCFPKDLSALRYSKKKLNLQEGIIEKTISNNEVQLNYFYNKIIKAGIIDAKKHRIAIWGLTFKPETDDLRESVSIKLINLLATKVHSLHLYDPMAKYEEVADQIKVKKNIFFYDDKYLAAKDSHSVVLATEWREFWELDVNHLKNKTIFDGRNIYDHEYYKKHNVDVIGIGL